MKKTSAYPVKRKEITWADMTPEERRATQILAETIDERLSKAVNRMFMHIYGSMLVILVVWVVYRLVK